MCKMFMSSLVVVSVAMFAASGAQANAALVNPAAAFCIEQGGQFGIRDTETGQTGICTLKDGTEMDAWDYFRAKAGDETMTTAKIANPAASHCVSIGGSYDLKTGMCALEDGSSVDAWELLRDAHGATVQLANPAATYCLEIGGIYEVREGEHGQYGVCTKPDGTLVDAWDLYRENH